MNPQSWNGYAYVLNNPMNATDPTGLCSTTDNPPCYSDEGTAKGDPDFATGPFNSFDWIWRLFYSWQVRNSSGGGGGSRTQPPAHQPSNPQSPPNNGFQKQFLPPNTQVCFSSGNPFYAPPNFDLSKIVAAGKAGGWSPFAANSGVGHYGTFDHQRSKDSSGNTTFYSGYTPASNFAVGAYLYGAGFDKTTASLISNTFALFRSSNSGDPDQATFRNMGYDMAASRWTPQCGPK